MNEYDPWAEFDPEAARVLKALFDQEWSKHSQPLVDASEDRAFAEAEKRMKAIYGSAYEKNRDAVLRFAIENNVPDVDIAFRAWRGSSDPQAVTSQEPDATSVRLTEIEARLGELKHKPYREAEDERVALKRERDELLDEQALAYSKAANADPERERQGLLHDENEARRRQNDAHTYRVSKGYVDKSSRESKDGRNARLEREAGDLVSGRTQLPTPKRKSSAEHAADIHGLDARDREALALVHEQTGEPEIAVPNAEAVMQDASGSDR